jgi:para-nitrobenzyl esterase
MISTPELKEAKFGSPSAEESGTRLAAALKAPDIAAMRAMDAATLTNAAPKAGYAPWGTIDGHVMLHQLVEVFDKGEQAAVPLLAGFNQGEIRSLRVLAAKTPANAADYEATIRAQYLDLADQFLRLYPSTDLEESVLEATRDALYGWTAERLVKKQTALGQPAFLYLWDHGYPAEDSAGLHAFHASELPFVFGTFDSTPPHWPKVPATAEQKEMSDAVIGYWTSFARTGRPQAANEPDWPAFGTTGAYMDFTQTPHVADHLLPGMYEFNEEVVCLRRAAGNVGWNWNVGLYAPKISPQQAGCTP